MQVVGDYSTQIAPALLTQTACVQLDQAQRDCLLAWTTQFANRAPRAEESGLKQAIVAAADGMYDMDLMAMEGVLKVIFIAPSFLYRTELGAPAANSASKSKLQPLKHAVKLSYFATLGPPRRRAARSRRRWTIGRQRRTAADRAN